MGLTFKITYSEQFDKDIQDIHAYIVGNLRNPEAASSQIFRLFSSAESLALFPKRNRVRMKDTHGNDIRLMPVDNYVIAYSINEAEHVVNVSRVFYGRRDIDRLI